MKSAADNSKQAAWPELPLAAWQETYATLHMWTQIVGKVRLVLTPLVNHWWEVPFYVSARGLTTSAIPYRDGIFEVEFDFIDHKLTIETSWGSSKTPPLQPQTIGKDSPVHFFWGSFDLCVTRFSGRRAPERPDADPITREAYSHEVISAGFWPGGGDVKGAAFYAYAAPEPPGFAEQNVQPAAAFYHPQMKEFLLMYDDVRQSASPREALLSFLQSTYDAGASLAHWDRKELERL